VRRFNWDDISGEVALMNAAKGGTNRRNEKKEEKKGKNRHHQWLKAIENGLVNGLIKQLTGLTKCE
jgi:hypothetical protein